MLFFMREKFQRLIWKKSKKWFGVNIRATFFGRRVGRGGCFYQIIMTEWEYIRSLLYWSALVVAAHRIFQGSLNTNRESDQLFHQ